jgi:phage-related protein
MESRPQPHNEAPRPYRPYQPPAEGHHSGQWLNQHRNQPLEQQRQALQNDRDFRRLPPDRQQKFEQRLQRFDNMPPEHQERVLRRMETWEHLTPQQKQTFRATDSQFRSLPPDRRQAVRNAIESLRAMPPQARQREIESGRFNQFSPQERQVLNDAAQLPLAPAEAAPHSEQPKTGPQRYIPRPPH